MPPIVLIAVVAIGVAGRPGSGSPDARSVPSAAPIGPVAAAAAAEAVAAAPSAVAGPRAALGVPYQHDREEGTDGLMGGLAFGLPADTPLVRRERVNRFTIDDATEIGRASCRERV